MGVDRVSTAQPAATPVVVIDLDDERGSDPVVVGAKAAALVTARRAGLPVLPGFAVTTAAATAIGHGAAAPETLAALRQAWTTLSDGGGRARRGAFLVGGRRWCGVFDGGALHVGARCWRLGGLPRCRRRRCRLGAADDPMGVLVQPLLEPALGRCALRRRSGDRPHRPSRGQRRRWWTGSPRQRPGRRGAVHPVSSRPPRRAIRSAARGVAPWSGHDGNWHGWLARTAMPCSDRPRTSNGRSTPMAVPCCCRAVRSRRSDWTPAPSGRCSALGRWPRRSPRGCARSRRISGWRRCATASARHSGSLARHRRVGCARARWSSSWTAGWRPTSSCSASPSVTDRCSPASTRGPRRAG